MAFPRTKLQPAPVRIPLYTHNPALREYYFCGQKFFCGRKSGYIGAPERPEISAGGENLHLLRSASYPAL